MIIEVDGKKVEVDLDFAEYIAKVQGHIFREGQMERLLTAAIMGDPDES